jgi:hypothetical protein
MFAFIKTKIMIAKICTILLFVTFHSFAQNVDITIINKSSNQRLVGVQVLSKDGGLLLSSNAKGQISRQLLIKTGIKSIVIYDPDFEIMEYKTEDIPDVIYLAEKAVNQLDDIIINARKKDKRYFKVRGYARSWQLSNGLLVKYGDAIIEYNIPYDNKGNDMVTGIKKNIMAFRTFNTDSTKQKPWGLVISGYDPYFEVNIPRRDILKRQSYKEFNIEMNADSVSHVFSESKNVGYVLYDENNTPVKINIIENIDGEEKIKNIFFKYSYSSSDTEKWMGEGNERHLSYSFSNEKKIMESKLETINIETVNEIFIDDIVMYFIDKPKNAKKHINKYLSYYNYEFWKEEIEKHPLPAYIESQLINANENRNSY